MARRVSAWTTNGLLSALVLVAGLGFGRQVVRWWAAEAGDPVAAAEPLVLLDALGDPTRMHDLEFGGSPWRVSRQSVAGSRDGAVAALRSACRRAIPEVLPDDPAGPAEADLLRRLSQHDPVESEPGKWQLYALLDRLPLVVVTAGPVALEAQRVVTWGLAIPTGEEAWTVYTFRPTAASEKDSSAEWRSIPLPPGSRKILSLQVDGGGVMLTFEGQGTADGWKRHFDARFFDRGWAAGDVWRQTGSGWHRRYTRSARGTDGCADLHLRPDDRGALTGLLMVHGTPEADRRSKTSHKRFPSEG